MNQVKQLIKETKKYMTKYDYDKVSQYCDRILELEPDSGFALQFKTIANYQSGKYKQSLKCCEKLNSLQPGDADTLKMLADINEKLGNYDEALETYDEYFKYVTKNDKDWTMMKINQITCMESCAMDLYNQDLLEQSYNILKEAYQHFKKISDYHGIRMHIAWYTDVLADAIEKSDDNPVKFFNNFYTPDKKQTMIWIKKIDSESSKYDVQKRIGNKTYYDILWERNQQNFELAIHEARKYHFGIQRPKIALPLYERVLKIDPNNKEVLNHKFSKLITDGQYEEAYHLLTQLEIYYPIINYSLNELTDYYINNRKYERAKYCLELLLKEGMNYKTLKKIKYVWDKTDDTECQKECPYYLKWIKLLNYKHEENVCPHCQKKLIPIKYGVIMANDPDYRTGKYYASENINHEKNRPTDYCNSCKKEIYHGFCGIDLTEDNTPLTWYAKQVLSWLIDYMESNEKITPHELEKAIYEEFSINREEYEALLRKLETIEFIEYEKNTIKLWQTYTKFKNSVNEMYHFRTKIFKNEKQLEEYSKSTIKPKIYTSREDYVEDVKICLMTSGWHYTYERATELLKGDERDLGRNYEFEGDPWDDAMETGFVCG